jgi:hypothetical protein
MREPTAATGHGHGYLGVAFVTAAGTRLVLADTDRYGNVDAMARKPRNTPGGNVYRLLNPDGHRDGSDHTVLQQ